MMFEQQKTKTPASIRFIMWYQRITQTVSKYLLRNEHLIVRCKTLQIKLASPHYLRNEAERL